MPSATLVQACQQAPSPQPAFTPTAEGVQVPTSRGLMSSVKTVGVASVAGVLAEAVERLADRFSSDYDIPEFVVPFTGAVVVASVVKGQQGDMLGSIMAFNAMKDWAAGSDMLDFLD